MCKKFEPERKLLVHTDTILEVNSTSFEVEGSVVFVGEGEIEQYGFCYSENNDPNVENSTRNELGSKQTAGSFQTKFSGLTGNTTYYVRAYASDPYETVYGNVFPVKTIVSIPLISTTPISSISQTSATSGGTIIDSGGVGITSKGVCWATDPDPDITDPHTSDGSGSTTFTSTIEDLNCEVTYYLRAYATNLSGTGYGDVVSFTTSICDAGLPTVSTSIASSITETTAICGGTVSGDGGATVSERGVCWSISTNPTLEDDFIQSGSGKGDFSLTITGLSCNTKYYVRAYARNASGLSYGAPVDFSTSPCSSALPTLSTTPITGIGETTAQGGGNISDDGGATVTSKGVCWSSSEEPTLSDPHTEDGSGTGIYTSAITSLTGGVKYYVRAYATNSSGTAYGNQVMFTTDSPLPPSVSTTAVSGISESTASSGGNVTSEGSYPVTSKGVCWSTSPGPTPSDRSTNDGTGEGSFTSSMDGLDCNTKYYVRAYAISLAGTVYGEELDFTTGACPPGVPVVTTAIVSSITESTAQGGGDVTDDGGATVSAKGICWSTSPTPTIADAYTTDGSGTGSFVSELTGLSANITYYVRAYGTNSLGTGYGNEVSFNTNSEIVTDYDGNQYPVVVIGDQTWMGENLRVTHYSDGTAIPLVENNTLWDNLSDTENAYCWNGNNATTGSTYGALYTWAAAMKGNGSADANPSGVQGVCPTSWHLPSDSEWKQLEMHLGMSQVDADGEGWRGSTEGGELKESGTVHWNPPNTGANDDSGFTALPGGNRYDYGTFNNVGNTAFFWTTLEISSSNAMGRSLSYNIAKAYRSNYAKSNGFSVRCIRDE